MSHNRTSLDCGHPYTVAFLTFIDRTSHAAYLDVARRCGVLQMLRPACETRVVKTDLDTALIVVFSTVLAFFLAEDLLTSP